jgi:hypothetical protein
MTTMNAKARRPIPPQYLSLLGPHPSLAPELERLADVEVPTAGPPAPPAEQLLLIPPDPAEGRKPRASRARRR